MSPDVSDDVTSCESLSFTSLVCIQNQHLTPQRGYTSSLTHGRKASQEFEFSHATAASRNKYSAETMVSNSHLEPHAKPFSSNQTASGETTSSKLVIPSAQSKHSRSDFAQTLGKPTRKVNTKVRNETDQNRTSGRQGFGQRIFKSFTTPCKDCRTIEPMQGKLQQKIQYDH